MGLALNYIQKYPASKRIMPLFSYTAPKKIFLFLVKTIIFLIFLYLWNYWTALILAFSDEVPIQTREYIWAYSGTFIANSGILFSIMLIPRFLKYIALLLLIITSCLYISIFFAPLPAFGIASTGLLTSICSAYLLISHKKEV